MKPNEADAPARPATPEPLTWTRPPSVGIDRFRRLMNSRRDDGSGSRPRFNDATSALTQDDPDQAAPGECADDRAGASPASDDAVSGHHADAAPRYVPPSRPQRRFFASGDEAAAAPSAFEPHELAPAFAPPSSEPGLAGLRSEGSGGERANDDGAWAAGCAEQIAALCLRAGDYQNWSATLPLDAKQLPETLLRLELSPHWLSLRFSTQSATSANLISKHRDRLRQTLEATPGLPRGIGIELA